MLTWRSAVPALAIILLAGCATSQSGGSGPGDQPGAVADAPCEQLDVADDMRAVVDSSEQVDLANVRFDDTGVLRDVGCAIGAASGRRVISVGLSVNVQPCSRPELFEEDPETGGWFATATNGGISFTICTPDGANLHAAYISFEDVPGPSADLMRSIVMRTLAQVDLLREMAAESIAVEDAPAADGACGDVPEVLELGGTPFDGCVIEVYPSDVGVVSVIAVEDENTYSEIATAIEAAGLETVYCSDEADGRYCGWNGEYGNVNQIELAADSSDNRWGVEVVLVDVEIF